MYLCLHILQLSILVHPDKNETEKEKAQLAFEGEMAYLCMYLCTHCLHSVLHDTHIHAFDVNKHTGVP